MNGDTFSVAVLDEAIAERHARRELERHALLAELQDWLDENGAAYGVPQAYIFGSLVQPGRFREDSDIDIAVTDIADGRFFTLAAALCQQFGREVDLIELRDCHFAAKIKREGILWIA